MKCIEKNGWEVYMVYRVAPVLDGSIHGRLHGGGGGSKKVYMKVGVSVMEREQDGRV